MNHRIDSELHDEQLLAEIELVTAVMIAAAEFPGRVPQPTLDSLLGVVSPQSRRTP